MLGKSDVTSLTEASAADSLLCTKQNVNKRLLADKLNNSRWTRLKRSKSLSKNFFPLEAEAYILLSNLNATCGVAN